ncbi:MAG: gliding motility lipoprotein GldK [Flavobacteriaceae bacterium]|nr:gliding motility lipoprotein GldK [Flavobacteriaceae bacterium]MDO7581399.1 gliding motility lipoprotein GldK [Flavobacteriaceae bacterium]MDO7615756.1 gliding motility lipoprotein GldK [Flavobacteriaceae bacterium]MDO7703198.1 gliding motility lipoprotein GldK [Flavobacteriaceae bacterium]
MKKIFILFAAGLLLIGCGNKRGELVGVKQKKWFPEKPFGMTLVEGGAYIMGKADDDMAQLQNAQAKTVTVRSFYMDETEITNSEYRQFVYWVRDSIALQMLAAKVEELNEEAGTDGIGAYAFADADTSDISVFQRYMKENYYDDNENTYANRPLNWDEDIEWSTEDYVDLAYVEVMDELYLPPEVWYNGEMKLDVNKLKFRYRWFDAEQAALDRKKDPNLRGRSDYIYEEDNLEIYPDTTVWIKDFNYSYNEPMHNDYFSHPAYQDYPVVGVSWDQAVAFCVWRTSYKNSYQKASNKPLVNYFRLPTEAEWEYAARGGIPSGIYPWGSPYLLNDRGCFLANFKPLRGDYSSDQAMYTVEAKSYLANDYNLYNMAGNVAEWTGSSYDPGAYEYVSSLNPNLSLSNEKRKVVRGGSWKDVAYFLRVSSRDYEYKDTARSYIGFRTVQDYLGSEKVKIK